MKKYSDEKQLRATLTDLLEWVQVVSINQDIIKKSLKSRHKDFEDAIQLAAAYTVKQIDCIVTRNGRDFIHAEILVLASDELVARLS